MDNDVLELFAAYQRAKNLSDNTIRNRQSILTGLRREAGVPFAGMTVGMLRIRLGRPGISAGTRRTERGAFLALFEYLVEDGIRENNPAARLAPVSAPKGEPRPFTWEQVEAMLRSGAYARTRAMILIGYYQGFRVSSIARVHGADIDLEADDDPDSRQGREDAHAAAASGNRRDRAKDAARRVVVPRASGPSRSRQRCGRNEPHHAGEETRRDHRSDSHTALAAARVRNRSGFDEGVDIRIVKELMMHESLATTQIYTGVSARRKQDGIRSLPTRAIPERSGRSSDMLAA